MRGEPYSFVIIPGWKQFPSNCVESLLILFWCFRPKIFIYFQFMSEAFVNWPEFSSHVGMYGWINNPRCPSSAMASGYSCRGKIVFLLSLPCEIRVRGVCKAVFSPPRSFTLSSCVIWLYCCNPPNPIVKSAPRTHTQASGCHLRHSGNPPTNPTWTPRSAALQAAVHTYSRGQISERQTWASSWSYQSAPVLLVREAGQKLHSGSSI